MSKECNYPFLLNYLSEEKQLADEARKHGQECMICLESAIRLEMTMRLHKKSSILENSEPEALTNDRILAMAEEFSNAEPGDTSFLKDEKWQKLWASQSDFAIFKELLFSIESKNTSGNVKTPDYLKNIVADRLSSELRRSEKPGVVIRMKEGLQLMGSYLENIFELPSQNDAFAVRSSTAMGALESPVSGILQFFSKEEQDKKILYQVVQDGESTVMLTVKLQDFNPLPRLMKIMKDDRIIYSFQVKEDFAYFPKLVAGDYVIELKDKSGATVKSTEISIVDQ